MLHCTVCIFESVLLVLLRHVKSREPMGLGPLVNCGEHIMLLVLLHLQVVDSHAPEAIWLASHRMWLAQQSRQEAHDGVLMSGGDLPQGCVPTCGVVSCAVIADKWVSCGMATGEPLSLWVGWVANWIFLPQ
jgi:hypothetical protein